MKICLAAGCVWVNIWKIVLLEANTERSRPRPNVQGLGQNFAVIRDSSLCVVKVCVHLLPVLAVLVVSVNLIINCAG